MLPIQRINPEAVIPTRATPGSAGMDLYAIDDVVIQPGDIKLLKLGIKVAIPEGYYGRIAPRSGLAVKYGIDVLAGVVDADYRHEVGVVLINHGKEAYTVKKHDRIAQLIIERIAVVNTEEVESLDDTQRSGGFGSTGK